MSHAVSIWGVFPDQTAAGEALTLLESNGFRQGQIAIEKRFRAALAGFDWNQAAYVRLPEGIVAGFAGGAILAALLAVIVSRGVPPIIPATFFICIGCVLGTVLGAFAGLVIARLEAGKQQQQPADSNITIGVLCFDSAAEDRAKIAFQKAGAASIDTVE